MFLNQVELPVPTLFIATTKRLLLVVVYTYHKVVVSSHRFLVKLRALNSKCDYTVIKTEFS